MAKLKITERLSPNFDARPNGCRPDMLVLHYTGMETGGDAIERLADVEAKVSAHYVVEEDGNIIQMVVEENRAWHAGVSHWAGQDSVNDFSIGIEIVNPGHEWGYRAFPDAQMQAVLQLAKEIVARYSIPRNRVVGHSDVAFMRKDDPGELFNWQMLADNGVGFVAPDEGIGGVTYISSNSSTEEITDLQSKLKQFGYGLHVTGDYGEETVSCVTAFQRHWFQNGVSGLADAQTMQKLDLLLKQS
ncbi:MAG: N-acetylmuramoyl-L-alanine amidase [Sphingomonadales bacterium]|nr:N-acetylmuramoyl-L-alanine amidase [Sphingomonadales bacterium]